MTESLICKECHKPILIEPLGESWPGSGLAECPHCGAKTLYVPAPVECSVCKQEVDADETMEMIDGQPRHRTCPDQGPAREAERTT